MDENTDVFVERAQELLSATPPTDLSGADRMVLLHISGAYGVPPSPQYRLLEAAHMLRTLASHDHTGSDARHPRHTLTTCEVCGDPHAFRGWCKKHYAIARDKRSATAPFLSPAPTNSRRGRPPTLRPEKQPRRLGRPPGPPRAAEGHLSVVRLSLVVTLALDAVRGTSSRSLTVEAILRSALGLEPTAEMTADNSKKEVV